MVIDGDSYKYKLGTREIFGENYIFISVFQGLRTNYITMYHCCMSLETQKSPHFNVETI